MQKTTKKGLFLNRETVRHLDDAQLRKVNGGARIYTPIGRDGNTDPVYSWVEDPNL